jgi:hypothetical protein
MRTFSKIQIQGHIYVTLRDKAMGFSMQTVNIIKHEHYTTAHLN